MAPTVVAPLRSHASLILHTGYQATAYFSKGLWSLMVLKPRQALREGSPAGGGSCTGFASHAVLGDIDGSGSDEEPSPPAPVPPAAAGAYRSSAA